MKPSPNSARRATRTACSAGVLLLLALTCAAAAPQHARLVLPNGLTVIAVQDPSAAVAAFHLAVRVSPGSIPDKKAGISAVSQQIAQLALQETLKQPEWSGLGEEVLGTRAVFGLNTDLDYCEARGQLSEAQLEPALRLLATLFFGEQAVTEEQLNRARDALTNVVQDSAENVVEATYYRFLRALHGADSPYARPIHGTVESLAGLNVTDVQTFRNTFIGANNAILTLIAPRPTQDLLRLATATFGSCRKAGNATTLTAPPLLEESRISVAALADWRGSSLIIGVPLPTYGSPDFLKAQLVFTLLEGKHGRLERDEDLRGTMGLNRLMNREYQPSVTILPPAAAPRPYLALHTLAIPRLMEPAREAILKHLIAFTEDAPEAAELQAGKTRLLNSYALLHLSRLNTARTLTCLELYGQDYRRAWEIETELRALTGEALVAFAGQYFQHHAIGIIMPGESTQ